MIWGFAPPREGPEPQNDKGRCRKVIDRTSGGTAAKSKARWKTEVEWRLAPERKLPPTEDAIFTFLFSGIHVHWFSQDAPSSIALCETREMP